MSPDVAIVLCTYNGASFLKEQLASFSNQTHTDWQLFVYDDGSTDDTKLIVEEQKKKYSNPNKINFITNLANMGVSKNFLYGLIKTSDNFSFYAFADQDDIWLDQKLKRAITYLQTIDNNIPAIYCSRTIIADINGQRLGLSPLFRRKPSFANSLVQSIAGGNTMVLNKAAKKVLAYAKIDNFEIAAHDWFLYQLITGVGGMVFYDTVPEIIYRQHKNNLMGSNNSIGAKIFRIKLLLKGYFRIWNDQNTRVLMANANFLTKENRNKLEIFSKARNSAFIPRIIGFVKCKIYRQTLAGNLGLIFAGLINKV